MINVAVIGTGNISGLHIGSYLGFPDRCKLTTFVDIIPGKAEQKAKEFGVNVKTFTSHKDILNDPDIDLVSICTPPFCHAEITIDFLMAGKNVIVEKPMAASLEECDRMIEAAEKSGKVLSVIAQNRFRDPIKNLKSVLDSGMIGRVVHAQVDSFWWRGSCYYDLWWRGRWDKEGGGCTLNHAVHHIDMLGWMLGLPSQVTSVITNAGHDNSEVEDLSVAIMHYDKGSLAQVTSSVVHHGEEQQLIFQGERARISAPWRVCASTPKSSGFPLRNEELEKELQDYYDSLPTLTYTEHKGQLENVLTAIEQGLEPAITGESGRMTIELITAIYKAGTKKATIDLPIQKDDPYYTVNGILENVPRFYKKTAALDDWDSTETTFGSNYGKDGEKKGDI